MKYKKKIHNIHLIICYHYYKSSYWESYEKGVTHKPGESDVNRLDKDFRDGLKYLFKS